MSVDRNEKIWDYTITGTRGHAFVQEAGPGSPYLRAMCRSTINKHKDSGGFMGQDDVYLICARCIKLANAVWDRAEASMEPADPYSDDFPKADETATVQGQPVETLADAQQLVVDEVRRANQLPNETAVLEALDSPAVMDALHAESLKMNREWDKSVAGYAHHYGSGPDAVVAQLAADGARLGKALEGLGVAVADAVTDFQGLKDVLSPAPPRFNRQQRRKADRQARRVAADRDPLQNLRRFLDQD